MRDTIEYAVNALTVPPVLFSVVLAGFFLLFPPTDTLYRVHRRLRAHLVWTGPGAAIFFALLTAALLLGLRNPNFRALALKPDNIPIVGLFYLMPFFLWLSMRQATLNDARLQAGDKPNEYHDPEDRILVWPDLVYIELIAAVLMTVLLIVWSLGVAAPLEAPANPTVSPNPSKAPWYFLGLQELLVYFDPWIAGVMLPTIMIVALMAIPYIDVNPEGRGYYSFERRKMAIALFLFCWLVLWLFLIFIGTFLRGPNWAFFGPFEPWDVNKFTPQATLNLSEFVYAKALGRPVPEGVLLRECWGIALLGFYFFVLPALLAKTSLKKIYLNLGALRYTMFMFICLVMFALPVKMYLRWLLNLKYIVALPEFHLNI